jgi:hypothetical protein
VFEDGTPFSLRAIERALAAYRMPARWQAIVRARMAQGVGSGPATVGWAPGA